MGSLIYNQQQKHQQQLSYQICHNNLPYCSCSSCCSSNITKMGKTNSLIRYYASSSSNDNNNTSPIATTPLSDISNNDTKLVLDELSKDNENESIDKSTDNTMNNNNDNTSSTSLDDIPGTK